MGDDSYETAQAKRKAEWERAMAIAAKRRDVERERISKMPDVTNRPDPFIEWAHEGIACPGCGGHAFFPHPWVTVNGVRYRVGLRCANCQRKGTWGWDEMGWLE